MSNKIEALDKFEIKYRVLNETDKKEFSKIINKFMKETFILKELSSDNEDYFFCVENREMISGYFALIDYDFMFDQFNSLFYIKSIEDRNRVRLTKFDTAVVLILRQLYFLKRKEINSENKVMINLIEIMDKLRTSKIFSDDKKVSNYTETLRKLRAYKIISYVATKIDADLTIQILPSIQIIVSTDKLDEVIAKLNGLKKEISEDGGEDNENIDED